MKKCNGAVWLNLAIAILRWAVLGEEVGVAFDKEGNVNFRAVKPTDVAPQASYAPQELEGMVKRIVNRHQPLL